MKPTCLFVAILASGLVGPLAGGSDKAKGFSPLVGFWKGTLKVGAAELTLFARVVADKDGKLTGSFDSPDQGARQLPLTIELKGSDVRLELKIAAAVFEGK